MPDRLTQHELGIVQNYTRANYDNGAVQYLAIARPIGDPFPKDADPLHQDQRFRRVGAAEIILSLVEEVEAARIIFELIKQKQERRNGQTQTRS